MSKHWTEPYDPARHENRMWGEGGETEVSADARLDPRQVYFVRVCRFTFEFHTVAQIDVCRAFFSQKIRPSSRVPWDELKHWGGDTWECQRWFDKLPQWLLKESKRLRVVKALERARDTFA